MTKIKASAAALVLMLLLMLLIAGCAQKENKHESDCGKLPTEQQAKCCRENSQGAVVQCLGTWQYNEEISQCEFKCTE
ncbi:hypothetical protein HYY73_01695 [Candidatus Woesearchaeota archaeon]|nr:hypothetical protein [Candidatus Woesearchaeota archaeon]